MEKSEWLFVLFLSQLTKFLFSISESSGDVSQQSDGITINYVMLA